MEKISLEELLASQGQTLLGPINADFLAEGQTGFDHELDPVGANEDVLGELTKFERALFLNVLKSEKVYLNVSGKDLEGEDDNLLLLKSSREKKFYSNLFWELVRNRIGTWEAYEGRLAIRQGNKIALLPKKHSRINVLEIILAPHVGLCKDCEHPEKCGRE